MTWIQKLIRKFICLPKGHIQIRDWQLPTFVTIGQCDRCGCLTRQHWTYPRWWNTIFSGK